MNAAMRPLAATFVVLACLTPLAAQAVSVPAHIAVADNRTLLASHTEAQMRAGIAAVARARGADFVIDRVATISGLGRIDLTGSVLATLDGGGALTAAPVSIAHGLVLNRAQLIAAFRGEDPQMLSRRAETPIRQALKARSAEFLMDRAPLVLGTIDVDATGDVIALLRKPNAVLRATSAVAWRVLVLDRGRLLRESLAGERLAAETKARTAYAEAEFGPNSHALKARRAEIQREVEAARHEIETRLFPLIEQTMNFHGANMLLDHQAVLLSPPDADVTDELLAKMDAQITDVTLRDATMPHAPGTPP